MFGTTDLFREVILQEARHPAHTGELPDADLVQEEKNASCGDEVTVYVNISGNAAGEQRIDTLAWQGTGCSISMAAMSLLAKKLQSMPVAAVQQLQQAEVESWLGLEGGISIGRRKCLLLGLQAVQRAVRAVDTIDSRS